jgi:hypothetical protein
MHLHHILPIIVLSMLICGTTQACVGDGVPDQEEIAQWVEDRTEAAAHVFLARITRVRRSGKIPALDTTAEFELLETVKGAPRFSVLSISECQNFELKENDVRVLFVADEGMILAYTDYLLSAPIGSAGGAVVSLPSNKPPLVPTRNREAPLLAAQRRR